MFCLVKTAMYKISKILLLFSLVFCFSCFEAIEEISLSKDGSGKIAITLNLSQSRTKLASIMLLDSIHNYKVPSQKEIERELNNIKNKISKIKGTSELKVSSNFKDYIFSITCNFTSVEVLNKVVASFSNQKNASKIKKHKQFSFNTKKGLFKRSYHYNVKELFAKVKKKNKAIFNNASFTTIYRFSRPITHFSNTKARRSPNKKAILLMVKGNELVNGKESIKNQIFLN